MGPKNQPPDVARGRALEIAGASAGLGLMLLALAFDLFGGNRRALGERQIAAMAAASLALVLLSWRYGRGSWPDRARQVAAAVWLLVAVLGFAAYPGQWAVQHALLAGMMGLAMELAARVPLETQRAITRTIENAWRVLVGGLRHLGASCRRWLGDQHGLGDEQSRTCVFQSGVVSRTQLMLLPLLSYAFFFAALFLQFPLQKAIPGNSDSWLVIALSNTYLAKAQALLSGLEIGRAMYPVPSVFAYGEAAPGSAFLFILYKLVASADHLAYFGYITTIFVLNAFGIYLLATLFVDTVPAAMLAGFTFACSNLMFAHVDDSIVFFYFWPALSIFFLIRFFREGNKRLAYASAVLCGIQAYFSVYVFIYQTIALLLCIVFSLLGSSRQELKARLVTMLKWGVVYSLVAIPIFAYYWLNMIRFSRAVTWDPFAVAWGLSLRPGDLFRVLPGNLVYQGTPLPQTTDSWSALRHYAFIGGTVMLLALGALTRLNWSRSLFVTMALVALLLAVGPILTIGDSSMPTPLYYFYEHLPLVSFLRVPVRAVFLVSLSISVLAAMGFSVIAKRWCPERGKKVFALAAAIMLVHFIENTPFPLKAYEIGQYEEIPSEYRAFFAGKENVVIVDLPSHFTLEYVNWDRTVYDDPAGFVYSTGDRRRQLELRQKPQDWWTAGEDLFEYNREVIYMNWQTQHGQNIVGGMNGYFPTPRLIYQRWVMDLPRDDAVTWLREHGVTHLVFHKTMVLPGEESLLGQLEDSPWLRKSFDGQQIAVFELETGPSKD